MKKLLRLLTTFWQILLGQLSVTAPEEFLIQKISPDYNLEQVLRELIHELRTKKFGKIRINKKGFCCDENGIRVPALCLRAGEIRVHDTLFILRIVYEREQNELYLLLVRSDCRHAALPPFPADRQRAGLARTQQVRTLFLSTLLVLATERRLRNDARNSRQRSCNKMSASVWQAQLS